MVLVWGIKSHFLPKKAAPEVFCANTYLCEREHSRILEAKKSTSSGTQITADLWEEVSSSSQNYRAD